MNHKIRKLLNKKKLTGEEFGKAYITTRLWDNLTNGKELILADEELKILTAKITVPAEINHANAYVNFHTWLDRAHLVAKSHYNHLYVGLSILYLKLCSTVKSEQGLANLKKMTEGLGNKDNNYQELEIFIQDVLLTMSVFDLAQDKEGLEYMQNARNTFTRGLPSVLSYNKSVDLFTDFFKIPEIAQVFKIETERLFKGIGMLNDKIVLLRDSLCGTKDEMTQKLKIVDDIYSVVNITDFEPTKAAIKKATKSMRDSIFSYNPYEIMKILDSEK